MGPGDEAFGAGCGKAARGFGEQAVAHLTRRRTPFLASRQSNAWFDGQARAPSPTA